MVIDEPVQVGEVVATACACGRLALLAWRESTERIATRVHVRGEAEPGFSGRSGLGADHPG